jgi:hypothetical protein
MGPHGTLRKVEREVRGVLLAACPLRAFDPPALLLPSRLCAPANVGEEKAATRTTSPVKAK